MKSFCPQSLENDFTQEKHVGSHMDISSVWQCYFL